MKNLLQVMALGILGAPLLLANFVLASPWDQPHAHKTRQSCTNTGSWSLRCHTHVITDEYGKDLTSSTPPSSAYTPTQFHKAYNLPDVTTGTPPTIAIVDAYDSPTIANDLNAYSAQFGLPLCTTTNPCFKKVNQYGQQSSYPSYNSGWAEEISLDVEIAHAICQNCNIILVEAASSSFSDLWTAEQTAASSANIVSNSWGTSEFNSEQYYDYVFSSNRNTTFTFSAGDSGYGVEYPAASPYVVAVGGTSLTLNSDNSRQSETVWSGTGSGCSAYESKPSFQSDTLCKRRTVVDVAAAADPYTGGAAVYINGSWYQIGGTSLASPLIAGVYALSGNLSSSRNPFLSNSYPYTHRSSLYDVTQGSNGSCSGSLLCSAGSGYDGPTGNGTPNGVGGF
jgi:subtilase family serine protease